MATIENQRYKSLCNTPVGESRLHEECLGYHGVEIVNVIIETCVGYGLRYIVTSGVYLEETQRVLCQSTRFSITAALQTTIADIKEEYQYLSECAEIPEEIEIPMEIRQVKRLTPSYEYELAVS